MFVSLYGPKINRWCRQWGLQPTDADDVTQMVLLSLANQMKEFKYDPNGRFRSWLKTVSYRAWVDFLKRRSQEVQGSGSEAVDEMLQGVEIQHDFLERMVVECDRILLEEAMLIVKARVHATTWRAFELTALENVPGPKVAQDLGIAITAVYKARSRIQGMLRAEIKQLDQQNS